LAHQLILPKLLNLPPKLLPLVDPEVFNKYNYFILKGGRGGAKSQSIGRVLLYLADQYLLRIVCGRETQNSIAESVYSLHADLIREYQLNFDIQASKITSCKTGSTINYRGFRDQGAFNVQGLEGVDIVHIDEAQAITKLTLDVLIPTIRKPNSKIFFSMNPHVFNDPVVMMLAKRPDCLVIDINYDENPHCPVKLLNEAKECRKLSEKDYQHIWMGQPLDQGDDALYSLTDFENGRVNAHLLRPGYGHRVAGFDIARMGDDKSACVIMQQMGALHWEEIYCDEWGKQDLNFTTGRILNICNEYDVNMAAIDIDGLGSGPFDTLNKGRNLDYFVGFRNPAISYLDNKDFGNVRTVNAYKFKDALVKGHRHIKTQTLIDELLSIKYTFDHNQRRILVSKDVMKTKYKIKSPNLADAVIMAESLIGQVKQKQNQQFNSQSVSPYSQEDNLFKIAGIR
jgi:phage terminase large subunit